MTYPDLPNSTSDHVLFQELSYRQKAQAWETRFDVRKVEHELRGCRAGCKHRMPVTIHEDTWRHEVFRNEYPVIIIEPNCAKTAECAARRKEIFDRAYAESWAEFEKYKSFHYAMSVKEATWKRITAEYDICPFYQS